MALFENALQDLRFGSRMLRKNAGVTAVAALSLALGIGANTAIFSLIDAMLLKMLPVSHPRELVLISDPSDSGVSMGSQSGVRGLFSCEEFREIRNRQQVFSDMYGSESNARRVSASVDRGAPEDLRERLVTGSYFNVLGVKPLLGRTFSAEDDRVPHGDPITVISYAYWDKRFARSTDVLGKVIKINKASLTVIGVAPPGFFGESVGDAPDLWIPMMMQPDVNPGRDWLNDNHASVERVMWLQVMGRLKPGISMQQAQTNVNVVFHQLLLSYRIENLSQDNKRDLLEQKFKSTRAPEERAVCGRDLRSLSSFL